MLHPHVQTPDFPLWTVAWPQISHAGAWKISAGPGAQFEVSLGPFSRGKDRDIL